MVVGPKGILRNFSTAKPVLSEKNDTVSANPMRNSATSDTVRTAEVTVQNEPQAEETVVVENNENSRSTGGQRKKKFSLERASRIDTPLPKRRAHGDEL